MAPLPAFRVSEGPPFSSVGVDFAGPLYYKTNKSMSKCYIALFSCSITRAVHLELVHDLSTATLYVVYVGFVLDAAHHQRLFRITRKRSRQQPDFLKA